MALNYLDKTGLAYFWSKIKTYVANATVANANNATSATSANTASTAATLKTARTINGVSFNGSANIVVGYTKTETDTKISAAVSALGLSVVDGKVCVTYDG